MFVLLSAASRGAAADYVLGPVSLSVCKQLL